jgi:serine/threonine-protein kinase
VTEPRDAAPDAPAPVVDAAPTDDAAGPPEPAAAPPPSDVGRLIDGRYRLGEVIGVGGMATIHRAFDTRLERPVAIKLLRPEIVEDADLAMRFRREALAATVLRHPNIVACLETGTDDGRPFLVMELIEGEDLAARLRRGGRLVPADAARIALDVARALGVAHVRSIVHRDIKPGNILLARDGRSMVTDFGIARLAADAEGAVPGMTLGSVHYFSPEQAKGETTTAASDVYSLGLVLFEALTGKRAWHGDTTAELAAARIDAPAPSPRAIRPEVPAALDAVVVRALDPSPGRRYPNGGAIAAALEQAIGFPDPNSPTVAVDRSALVVGVAAAGPAIAAMSGAARPGAGSDVVAPPLRPMSAADGFGSGAAGSIAATFPLARRTSPAIAGPLLVLVAVGAVVLGALLLATLPGRDAGLAVVPTATARPTPVETPRPTPTAVPTPSPKPTPTPAPPKPTPRPPGSIGDLCEPVLGFACGLGAGTYQPAAFEPGVSFRLGDGWSTSLREPDIISLTRDEGTLTMAGTVTAVYPRGGAENPPSAARTIAETFVETDGVAASRPKGDRVDKQRGTVVDLSPTGTSRLPLFSTTDQTFYLEPDGTTRIIVVDAQDGILVIAIEPAQDGRLEDIIPIANAVIDSLRFR